MLYTQKKLHTRQDGFTLLELLLAVGMTAVFLLTLILFTQNILEVQTKQRTIREVGEQGDLLMDKILTTIQNAESVTTPTGGSSGSTLELVYTVGAQDPTEITLTSGVISIEENNGGTVPLHSDSVTATNLTFTDRTQTDAWDTVDVEFTLSYDSTATTNPYQFEKTWYGTAMIRTYER